MGARGRPFVTYKAAVTLDGRVAVPGRRWVSGEESRRLVHELRAQVDAVAVGMGTARADAPRLTPATSRPRAASRAASLRPRPAAGRARPRAAQRAARRRARGARAARACSRCCSRAGRRSPRAFLARGLVDKLLALRRADARRATGRGFARGASLAARAVAPDGHGRSATTSSSRPMSTSPDTRPRRRPARHAPGQWLTRQLGNDELRGKLRGDRHRRARARRQRGGRRLCRAATRASRASGQLELARPRDGRDARLRRLTRTSLTDVHGDRPRGRAVAALDGGADGVRLDDRGAETAGGGALGDSVAIDGVCLTAVAVDGGRLAFDAVPETLAPHLARPPRAGVERQPRAGAAGRRAARRPLRPGPRRRRRHASAASSPRATAAALVRRAAPTCCATASRRARSPSTASSLTVAALDDAGFAVALIPHTLEVTTLGALDARRRGQPRGRRAREIRRAAARSLALHAMAVTDAVRDDRGGDRGHPRGPVRRRRRRRRTARTRAT